MSPFQAKAEEIVKAKTEATVGGNRVYGDRIELILAIASALAQASREGAIRVAQAVGEVLVSYNPTIGNEAAMALYEAIKKEAGPTRGTCLKHGRIMLHDGPCADCRDAAARSVLDESKSL